MIGEYFVQHALIAYHLMRTNPALEKAKRLWAIICSYGLSRFTVRELHQRRKRSFTVAALGIALDVLEDRGYIRKVNPLARNKVGRRPSQEYAVNPLAYPQNLQKSTKLDVSEVDWD